MAEELGRKLIADNERNTCTLGEILASLRQSSGVSASSQTGVPAIDEAVRLLALSRGLPNQGQLPSIIQVDGIGPSSGKTQLLYLSAARCLLGTQNASNGPAHDTDSTPFVCPPAAVVWLDLTDTFSASRLLEILKHEARRKVQDQWRMREHETSDVTGNHDRVIEASDTESTGLSPIENLQSPSASDREIRTALTQADEQALRELDHIHVFRPQSTPALLMTLASMSDYLFAGPSMHRSSTRPLRLLVIAGLSSFWWQDRHDSALASLGRLNVKPVDFRDAAASHEQGDQMDIVAPTQPDAEDHGSAIESAASADAESALPTSSTPAPMNRQSETFLYYQRWQALGAHIRAIQRKFGCTVLASDLALAGPRRKASTKGHLTSVQPHLPSTWTAGVTARFLVQRRKRRMPATISGEEALTEDKWYWNARREAAKSEVAKNKGNAPITVGTKRRVDQEEGDMLDLEEAVWTMESDLMINMWACEDWSRETWQALEQVRSESYVLRVGKGVDVISEPLPRRFAR